MTLARQRVGKVIAKAIPAKAGTISRGLPPSSAVLASYLGWTLDAFDFFLLVFVLKDIAPV